MSTSTHAEDAFTLFAWMADVPEHIPEHVKDAAWRVLTELRRLDLGVETKYAAGDWDARPLGAANPRR